MPDFLYLDYNASAPLCEAAAEAMHPWLRPGAAGNPSSAHGRGREARRVVEAARRAVGAGVGADARDVVFTSGATEANNLALLGAWYSPDRPPSRTRLVLPATEHPAVRAPAEALRARGAKVSVVPVLPTGEVDPEALAAALGDDVFLLTAMAVNNETGVQHDVPALARAAHAAGAWFHCDAAQAPRRVALDLAGWDVDLASLSGHKAGGPPGVGALVVRNQLDLAPQAFGGSQQAGRRPGTESPVLCAGMGGAFSSLPSDPTDSSTSMNRAAARLVARLRDLPGVRRNGARLAPGVFSLTFPGVDAEVLVIQLDRRGIAVSTGSACASGAREPSPVLLAMGLSESDARSTLRVSLGAETPPAHADALVDALEAALAQVAAARDRR